MDTNPNKLTSLALIAATEKLTQAMAKGMQLRNAYDALVATEHRIRTGMATEADKPYENEPDKLRNDLAAALDDMTANDGETCAADRELAAAYKAEGVDYAGATNTGAYNMYTYRDIEREARRRLLGD